MTQDKSLSEMIQEAINNAPPPPPKWKQLRDMRSCVETMHELDLLTEKEYNDFMADLKAAEEERWK